MDKFIPEPNSGCWLWIGGYHKGRGYGQFHICRKTVAAHRFSYFMSRGEPVKRGNPLVCHKCDVEGCVNPDHLWAGTPADNMQDKSKKGRAKRLAGERNGMSKLSEEDVRAIRSDPRGHTAVAADYGISVSHVHGIRNFRFWAHVR